MQKTINAAAGVRKRIAAGLPPYKATAEERAKFDKTFAEIQGNLDRRGKEEKT